jgi:archaetidylinositol phosphate synthase
MTTDAIRENHQEGKSGKESHKRINDILLGPLERPALQWLAARMPGWVNPDILTGVGLLGSAVIFFSYWLTNSSAQFLWLASLGLVINWFGDSLDGTLARFRKIERPKYGFFIDHTVDAVSTLLVVFGLGLSPYVRFEIACLALIGYLLMSVFVYIRTCVEGVFKISYGRFGPTEVRLIVIIANTIIYFLGNPTVTLPLGVLSIYDLIAAIVAIILTVIFLVSTVRQARELAKLGE